ncbi:MAG: hypothetical protein MZW92_72800 [Comamonadaceae bacterium]|nr:hypothetical protein [Comamonadaceae bacterium]
MIGMVESAKRQKTPNEQALEILLMGLTGLFVAVVISLEAFAGYMGALCIRASADRPSGLPHAYNHRGPAACHRHCRHG